MYTHGIARIPAEPYARRRHGTDRLTVAAERITGEERREVGSHRDRPDTGAAATVRDAERLVQVEMADVGTELARAWRDRPGR